MAHVKDNHQGAGALEEYLEQLHLVEEVDNQEKSDVDDDGYDSCNSEDKEASENLDDEDILEPLSIIPECQPVIYSRYNARGLFECQYNPCPSSFNQSVEHHVPVLKPTVRILKVSDLKNPVPLDAGVSWISKEEVRIAVCQLPPDTYYGESCRQDKVQIFLQINPASNHLKSFLADVKVEVDSMTGQKKHLIGPIVILLKTELAECQEKYLLENTTMEERTAAYNLVAKKDINQLTCGIGPHQDTVLSVLCAQRNPKHPGEIFAQIHAVIQRLIQHPERRVRQTVFNLNRNGISAFEISAITNNSLVACYLAEIMYNLTDDKDTALDNLLCKDAHGNTIIHLLARKGDSNKDTLKALLNLSLSDGSKMFKNLPNKRKQYPMHIATQSVTNQPETLRLLYESMPCSLQALDSVGMTALHYACQRSSDVELIRVILSFKKDNINVISKEGLSALDLISRRNHLNSQFEGLFLIEKTKQEAIIKLLKDNGATPGGYLTTTEYQKPESYNRNDNSCTAVLTTDSPDPFLISSDQCQQPSPGSDHFENSHSPLSNLSNQGSPHKTADSVQTYEDHLASAILNQFPEISTVLGQILEEDQ